MNIQDEMQKIHHKYGVSEKANYEIEKFVEKLIEDDRSERLILHNVSNCPSCNSDDLHQFKLQHIHCKSCKEDFERGCC